MVGQDEYETKGLRIFLNFGHTFAHAFEQVTGYRRLAHGEAVSLGMVCATRLAVRLGMFNSASEVRLLRMLNAFQLPVSLSDYRLKADPILKAMAYDKKTKNGIIRFILPTRIGSVVVRHNVPVSMVRNIMIEVGAK